MYDGFVKKCAEVNDGIVNGAQIFMESPAHHDVLVHLIDVHCE